ncbi:MAG: hypothetical protein R2854_18935 [Caldilineaceae bacterium]
MTCRTAAYQGRTALGRGFRELRALPPLTQEHIAALVRHAYAAIYPHDPTQATRKAEELIDGVADMERSGSNGWTMRACASSTAHCWCACCWWCT